MYAEVRSGYNRGTRIDSERVFSSQTVLYDLFKRMLGSGPVYAALGNHDSYNQCVASPS